MWRVHGTGGSESQTNHLCHLGQQLHKSVGVDVTECEGVAGMLL
jgi:hypothetical protein